MSSTGAPEKSSPPVSLEREISVQEVELNTIKYNNAIIEDIWGAIYDTRFIGPILAVVAGIFMYVLTTSYSSVAPRPFATVPPHRPWLHPQEIQRVKHDILHAETTFHLPAGDIISLRHFRHTNQHGNFHLPDLFYEGVTFSIPFTTSHIFQYHPEPMKTQTKAILTTQDSFDTLVSTHLPPPTHIFPRLAVHNTTDFLESGVALYYSYDDLRRIGKYSSDKQAPWKRIQKDIVSLAVALNLAYFVVWTPRVFGDVQKSSSSREFQHMLQSLVPVRSGYNSLHSDCVVWMSALNAEAPRRPPAVVSKPWTAEDHWTLYR